jgi:hypothetical protein
MGKPGRSGSGKNRKQQRATVKRNRKLSQSFTEKNNWLDKILEQTLEKSERETKYFIQS